MIKFVFRSEIVHLARTCPNISSLRILLGDKILRGEMTLHFGQIFFRWGFSWIEDKFNNPVPATSYLVEETILGIYIKKSTLMFTFM